MALTTQRKPKPAAKKRAARHHRQNKHYLKTYLPYLPMLGVIGLGLLINLAWPGSLTSGLNSSTPATETRVQHITGNNTSLLIVIIAASLAFGIFLFQHSIRVHRLITKGENFVIKHPAYEIALVAVFTAGAVLTRTSF